MDDAKVVVTLISKEEGVEKQALIKADFGLKDGKTWKPGARVTVPTSWFDSIPEWTGEVIPARITPVNQCLSCGGTGRSISGDIWAPASDDAMMPSDMFNEFTEVMTDTTKMSDKAKRRHAQQKAAMMAQDFTNDPAAFQEAQSREAAMKAHSPEGSCPDCNGTGKPKIVI